MITKILYLSGLLLLGLLISAISFKIDHPVGHVIAFIGACLIGEVLYQIYQVIKGGAS